MIAKILLRTLRNSTNHIMNVVTQKLKSHAHAGGIFDSSYKAFGNRGKRFVFFTYIAALLPTSNLQLLDEVEQNIVNCRLVASRSIIWRSRRLGQITDLLDTDK